MTIKSTQKLSPKTLNNLKLEMLHVSWMFGASLFKKIKAVWQHYDNISVAKIIMPFSENVQYGISYSNIK